MSTMRARKGNRPPSYIPDSADHVRDALMTESKATLAELVFDYLLRTVGESDGLANPELMLDELSQTLCAIRCSQRGAL